MRCFIYWQITIIATLQLLITGCSTSPKRPTTHTSVPSLAVSKEKVKQLKVQLQDAKDGVRRARSLNERIDYKANLLE